MSRTPTSLEAMVLAAFERACAEDPLEVADHLLAALEESAKDNPDERSEFQPQLAKAYALIGGRRLRSGQTNS